MNVLYVTNEIQGLFQTGGVAGVTFGLTFELNKHLDLEVAIPMYLQLKNQKHLYTQIHESHFYIENNKIDYDVYLYELQGIRVLLFNVDSCFQDQYIYKNEYIDFLKFNYAVSQYISTRNYEIVHCSADWLCGFIPYLSKRFFNNVSSKFLYTIHNHSFVKSFVYPGLENNNGFEFSPMLSAIQYSDMISTVSKNYRNELLYDENIYLEEHLRNFLLKRESDFYFVNNAIDDTNDPMVDKRIHVNYGLNSFIKEKQINKQFTQQYFHLPLNDVPLIAVLFRIVDQKGIQLLIEVLRNHLSDLNIQIVICADGTQRYIDEIQELTKIFPNKISYLPFDINTSYQCYAGADFTILPSLFEPCALLPMISMRYGAIPLVSKTGGMLDTTMPLIDNMEKPLWILPNNEKSLKQALFQTLQLYGNKNEFNRLIKKSIEIASSYTWKNTVNQYLALYHELFKKRTCLKYIEDIPQKFLSINQSINGVQFQTITPINCEIDFNSMNIFHSNDLINDFWVSNHYAPHLFIENQKVLLSNFEIEVSLVKINANDFHCGLFIELKNNQVKYLFGNHTNDRLVIQSPHFDFFNDIYHCNMYFLESFKLKIKIKKINNKLFFYYIINNFEKLIYETDINNDIIRVGFFSKNWSKQSMTVPFIDLFFKELHQ